jgi:Lon protease-like protein
LEDGRYDVITVGTQRFRLASLDDSGPYLRGQVDLLTEEAGDEAGAAQAARVVRDGFRAYLNALTERGVTQISAPELPEDPVTLSYLVAASMIIDLSDRQALLAEPDALRRLAAERALLSRELTMLRTLTATPAPDLRNSPYSSN